MLEGQWKKLHDVGTGHPPVARLTGGIFNILPLARLTKAQEDEVKGGCLEVLNLYLAAEGVGKPLVERIKAVQAQIEADAETLYRSRVTSTPQVERLHEAKVFLMHGKQLLQRVADILGIIFEHKFKGPHFDKVISVVTAQVGPGHHYTKMLQVDHDTWIKGLIELRNEDEHPKSGKPFLENFDLPRLPDGRLNLLPPRFFSGETVLPVLETYMQNLFTFAEEAIAHGLETRFPAGYGLLEIPEPKRNPANPIRYMAGAVKPY